MSSAQIAARYKAAMALHSAGRLVEAARDFAALEKLAPKLAEIPYQLGRIALQQKQPADAKAHFQRAQALKPDEPAILSALAGVLGDLQDTDAALAVHDRLISLSPKAIKPFADKALLLQRVGRFGEAEVLFRRALKRAPRDGELYRVFLATKKLKKADPLIKAMQKAWADSAVQGRARVHLGYALAKAMEDSGQASRVFTYLKPANDLLRKAQGYNFQERLSVVEGLMAAFRQADFTPVGAPSERFAPIFVTGMPRSGTTLVEQIIASHPNVTGGGELGVGAPLVDALLLRPGGHRALTSVTQDELVRFAEDYEGCVRDLCVFERYVTDKSIQSHLYIGLLLRAIPSARIIVVRRDPRDLGLSIYKSFFGETLHGYSSDLHAIGRYIASFERMIGFWQEQVPGRFHEVSYDALVADPEPESRALVAAAGLEWDPACLRSHENTRRVHTLSLHQVRQPIYASSRQGWRAHEADLAPLIETLSVEGVL